MKYVTIVNTDSKYIFWFKMNKSLFSIEEDVYFGAVYIHVPSEGSKYSSPDCFFEIEDELIKICKECKYVCLMGDFNSRVGRLNDFIKVDDFLTNVIQCNSVENDISSFFAISIYPL